MLHQVGSFEVEKNKRLQTIETNCAKCIGSYISAKESKKTHQESERATCESIAQHHGDDHAFDGR